MLIKITNKILTLNNIDIQQNDMEKCNIVALFLLFV